MRYFFNVRHHHRVVEDVEGIELDDMGTVRKEAYDGAYEIIVDRLRNADPVHVDTVFEVRDESGDIVYLLPFAAVLLSFLALEEVASMGNGSIFSHLDMSEFGQSH